MKDEMELSLGREKGKDRMKLSLPGRKFGGKKEADKLVHHGGING
jgi:hypothetical protein